MEHTASEHEGPANSTTAGQSNVLVYLAILSRWRRFIAYNVVVVTLVATIVSFLLPKWYLSSATVLPPRNQGLMGSLDLTASGLMRQFIPLRGFGGSGNTDLYNYLSILKSRTLSEKVIRQFDLFKVYGVSDSSVADAMEELKSNVDFKVNEEGTLQIEVLDKDRTRAASMAEFYVRTLDEMNQELSVREARSNREFIEQRLAKTKEDLEQAEDSLRKFQEAKGFVMMPEEKSSGISSIADMYAKKALKEVEVGILQRTVGEDNPQLKVAQIELSELNKKLLAIPQMGMSYLQLYRNFAIQEKIFETLTPLYEQAKINEKKDTPTLLVLDRAVPAERAARPKKKLIVALFFVLSLIVAVTIALASHSFTKLAEQRNKESEELRTMWRGWMRRFTRAS